MADTEYVKPTTISEVNYTFLICLKKYELYNNTVLLSWYKIQYS